MQKYTQLTHLQRYQIYALLRMGHLQAEIADTIGVHKYTISREIWRNIGPKRVSAQTSAAESLGEAE